jgi:phage portal protein BeeE
MGIVTQTLQRAMRTSPKNVPSAASGVVMADLRRVGKPDARLFRNWSEHSEWIRAAINIRKTQISAAEWDVVPFDLNKKYSSELAAQVKRVLDTPNPRADSFRSFIEPIVEDILVLDAGSVEKVRTLRDAVGQLWPVDGAKIRVNGLWDGDPDEARYFWYPDGTMRAAFKNADFIYIMANPRTYSPVGLAPLETLKLVVDAELAGHQYNDRQVRQAAPDGMLDLGEGARPEHVEAFKSYWLAEVAGKGAMAFIGGTRNAKFIPFRQSNRDAQFIEWQTYLVRKICAVFGLSPQDLGLTFDVNRSSGEVQQQNTEDRGVRPLLALIQDYLTREIVWDRGFGGPDNNLAFRFTRLNLRDTLNQAQIQKIQLAGVPSRSVNEIRREQGLEPWGPEFDEPMMVTPTGAVRLSDVPTAREAADKQSQPRPGGPAADGKKSVEGEGDASIHGFAE